MLKKFLIGTIAVLALGLALTASAADFGSVTLRVGSKGEAVKAVQTLVGATVDGSYGPMTAAKVKAWQANNGLVADGVFGKMSMAKANAGTTGTTTGGTFPAGCTSSVGFSSTTGAKCDGSTTGSTTAGPLVGGAGDINITPTTTDVEDSIIEGQSNTKILGFKVEAYDSDVKLTNLKVTLKNTESPLTTSTRLNRYVDSVSVYMGSTKVGTISADEFSKEGTTYSKSIALTDAIVREGSSKKATFYVTVNGVSNIDSADLDAKWTVTVDNVRFQDATGVIMTSSDDATNEVTVDTLSGSGDVKLVVSKDTSSPVAGNVEVSDTGSTSDVLLLAFKLKDTGSDMTFDQLTVHLDGTVAGTKTLADVLGELTLKDGSDELASYSAFTAADDQDVTFDLDDTYTLSADTTKVFKIYAKVNDVDNYTQGDSVIVSLPADDAIAAEDENGDTVVETGYATGNAQTFLSSGAVVTYLSDSFTAQNAADDVDGTIAMKFKVTAFGDNDVTIDENQFAGGAKTTGVASQAAGAGKLVFTVTGATTSGAVVTASGLTADAGVFTVTAGDSATFTLSVKTLHDTTSGFVQLALTNVDNTVVGGTVKTDAH